MAPMLYLRTMDEANSSFARRWCDQMELTFQLSFPRETLFPSGADALIIDLDHLGITPLECAQLEQRLLLTPLPFPIAVISYNLEPQTIKALQAKGVLVSRGLNKNRVRQVASQMEREAGGDAAA